MMSLWKDAERKLILIMKEQMEKFSYVKGMQEIWTL